MFKRKGQSDLEQAKENEIKHGISQELSATLKQLQKDNIGTEDQAVYSTDSANAVCNCLEAVFLHGLKGNRVKKIANYIGLGSQAQQQSNLNFWTLAIKFTHGEVVAQLKHLGQITTEIGLCRAWVRVALNDGLMESYIDAMVADKKTLEQYYHSTAYLRDQEHPEIIKTYLHGLMTFQFKLSYNASVLNEWSYQPLIMAGVIDATDAPPPVIKPAVPRQSITASPSKKIIQDDTNIEVRKLRSRSREESKNPMEQPAIGQQRGSPFQISSSEFTSRDVEAFKRLTYEQTTMANSECSSSSHISMPDTPHLNLSPAAYCQGTLAQTAVSEQEQVLGDDYSIEGDATDSVVKSSGVDPTTSAGPAPGLLDEICSEKSSSHVESPTDDEDKRDLEESWEDFYRSVDKTPTQPQHSNYKRMESLQRDIMEDAIISGFVDTEEPVLQVSSTTVVGSVSSEGVPGDDAEDLLVSSLKEAAEDFVEAMEKMDVEDDGEDGEIVTVEESEVEERLKDDHRDEQAEKGVLQKGSDLVEERIKVSKDDETIKLEKKLKKQRKKLHMKKLKPVFSAPDMAPLEPQPTEALTDTLDTAPMDMAENFTHTQHRLSLPIARYLRDPKKKSKRSSLPNVEALAEIYNGQPLETTEEDDTMTEAEERLRTSQLNTEPRQSIGNSLTTGRGWSSSFDSEHDDVGGAFSPPRPSGALLPGTGSPHTRQGGPGGSNLALGVSSSPIVCGTSPGNPDTSHDTGRRKSESFGTLLQNYTPSSSLSAPSIDDVLHNFPRKETILSPQRSPTGEDQDNFDGFEVLNTSDNPDPGESDTFSDNEDARSNLCKIQQQPDNDHGNIDTNVDDQGESDTFSDNEDVLSNLCKSQKQRDNDHGNIDTNFDDQGESDTFSDNEDVRSNLCKSQKQRDNDHGNIDTNFDDQGESDTFSDNEDVRSNLSHSQQENVNDHGNIDTNWDDQGKSDPSESQQLFDIPSLQRDINQPGIYIRKLTKSCKSSKAQASVKKVGNNRVYDNYHSCLFCGEMRQHIKLHLETHKHITEVKQLLANENPDIVRIRKLGDHKHNKKVIKHGKGQIILSRRPETDLDITRYGPCIICKEWVLLKNLKRHVTKCSGRRITVSKRHLIIQSQVEAGLISKSPSKLMLKEVFPCMRMDDIGQLAKSDTLIIALGESWLRRSIDNREKRKYYASQHMRLMAKLLIQIRKLDTSSANKELAEYLVPQHFDLIVAAALECCVPFMDDVEELQSPSNGIKIKYDLQRVLTARWAMLVKEDPHSVLAKEVQTCQELMKIEWADKIVKLSRTVLARRSLGMRKELPAPEDILKLTQFITEELKTTALSAENYTKIVKLAQTRLLVYNKRRSGELEAIRLENYAGKTRDIDEMDQSLIDDLTKVELHLLKSQELMQVRGKGNRPVPVLIPADAIKPLDYIASRTARREAGIPESNVYLFPNSGQSHARAYSSLKCLCDQCLLTYPGRITSVSMRKYTATLTQMLNLNPNQIDWVCKHLGHSSDVHKAHYRQMSGLIERVYVTKLLLLQDLNLTKKFKGQSLDEIDISDIVFPDGASIDRDFPDGASIDRNGTDTLLDNVVEDVAQTERDDEPVDRVVFEDSEDDGEDEDEFEDEAPPPKKIQKKVVRQRWDETEMKEIHEYFKLYLDSKITPRSHEVNSAKKKSKSNGGRIWLRTTDKIVKKISAMNHRK